MWVESFYCIRFIVTGVIPMLTLIPMFLQYLLYNTHAVYCLKYVIAITAVPMLMPKISALFFIFVVGARGQYRGQLYGGKLRVYKFMQPLMFWKVLGCTVALPIRNQETSPLANHHAKNLWHKIHTKSVTENTHKIRDRKYTQNPWHTGPFIEVALQLN